MDPAIILLTLMIITGPNRPDITRSFPMPDMKTCLEEAQRFLEHTPPAEIGGIALFAGCRKPLAIEEKG
jgi:hypothetical protein